MKTSKPAQNIDIHLQENDTAVVIFQYHTEYIRREDGSEYGIAGMETQVLGYRINVNRDL